MGQLTLVSNDHPTVNIFKPLRLKDGMRLCRQWNTWVLWHWQCDTALCQALYLPGPIQYSFTCENTCTTAFSISWKSLSIKIAQCCHLKPWAAGNFCFMHILDCQCQWPGLTSDQCFFVLFCFFILTCYMF